MARTREQIKGRKSNGSFAALPHHIIHSEQYALLSAYAVKLLVDLFGQFNGRNNGDYTAAWSIMCKRGWVSKATMYKALNQLIQHGWIVKTRQGGRKICSLYGVTWLAINECDGKLDIKPTRTPANTWKTKSLAHLPYQCSPPPVPM